MMNRREQDTSMERLLREALSARERTPQSECLDAETLAAWSERSLARPERAFAEAHAARCGRCQALLAAMARTTPDASSVRPSRLRTWIMTLSPAAAVAAAVALWFLVEPQQPPRSPVAQVGTGQPASTEIAPAVVPPAASPDPAAAQRDAAKTAAEPAQKELTDRAAGARVQRGANENREAKRVLTRKDEADAPPAEPQQATGVEQRLELRPPPPPPAAPAQPSLQTTAGSQQAADQAAPFRQEIQTVTVGAARQRTADAVASRNFLGGALVVSVAGTPIQWRVSAGRVIEVSLDGGATWETQVSAPESTILTAGAAPSAAAAWFVGRGGVVLRTADGRTWQRVPFPHAIDLVAVMATGAETAIIVTADKRTFSTTDGGATWVQSKG